MFQAENKKDLWVSYRTISMDMITVDIANTQTGKGHSNWSLEYFATAMKCDILGALYTRNELQMYLV